MHVIRKTLNHWLHQLRSSEHTFIVIVAIIIGVLGGLGAVGFRYLIRAVQLVAFQDSLFYVPDDSGFPRLS